MEPSFQFRPAAFIDYCQTTLDQQTGLQHVATTWCSAVCSATFSDYCLDGLQLTVLTGQLPEPLRVELYIHQAWMAVLYRSTGKFTPTPVPDACSPSGPANRIGRPRERRPTSTRCKAPNTAASPFT